MNSPTKQLVFGGAIAATTAVVVGILLIYLVRFFSEADANVKSALIASLVGLITLVATFLKERSKARQEAHREKKVEAYSEFFDILSNINKKSNEDPENGVDDYIASKEFTDGLFRLRRNVLLYGAPQVVKALSDWGKNTSSSVQAQVDPFYSLRPVGRLILAMRRDIGLSNFGLDEVNIHQINISDDLATMAASK